MATTPMAISECIVNFLRLQKVTDTGIQRSRTETDDLTFIDEFAFKGGVLYVIIKPDCYYISLVTELICYEPELRKVGSSRNLVPEIAILLMENQVAIIKT